MSSLVIYEAKVALLLAVFYICYRILLSHETLHRLNRIVLTGRPDTYKRCTLLCRSAW